MFGTILVFVSLKSLLQLLGQGNKMKTHYTPLPLPFHSLSAFPFVSNTIWEHVWLKAVVGFDFFLRYQDKSLILMFVK